MRGSKGARAQHGFHAQAAADQRRGHQVLGLEQAAQRIGGRHLGAVQQRQAFLGRQRERLQAGDFQRLAGRQPLAAMARAVLAQQQQGHVRQRRQVARRAHRALERNVRIDLGVDQRDQRVDDLAADAGVAARQAVDLQHHDQTHHGVVQRLAHAGRVRQHQRALQRFQVLARDAGGRQQAEAGVDAVGGAVLGDDALHAGHAGVDRAGRRRIQGQALRLVVDLAQVGQRELAGFQVQIHCRSPMPPSGGIHAMSWPPLVAWRRAADAPLRASR